MILLACWLWLLPGAAAVRIEVPSFAKTSYERFEKAEGKFRLDRIYPNVCDPDVVRVDALIALPDGRLIVQPCFFWAPVVFFEARDRAGKDAAEHPEQGAWMVRFTSAQAGVHRIRIRVQDDQGVFHSEECEVPFAPSAKRGFVRTAASARGLYRHDDSTPFHPVGFNRCWNDDHSLDDYYRRHIDEMSRNRINWFRYWLCGFARQTLEWSTGHWSQWYSGLGVYSQRASALLDLALAECEEKGVRLQLVIRYHGQFSTQINPEWGRNPYNEASGGFLTSPGQFFTDARAKAQEKKHLRYLVARWGYSTSLFSWEFFNEINLVEGAGEQELDRWLDEMAGYLKEIDPYGHIRTVSATSRAQSLLRAFDDNPCLDSLDYHVYGRNLENLIPETALVFLDRLKKPLFCGEFGNSGFSARSHCGCVNHPDLRGDHVRRGTWLPVFCKVPHAFWFWGYCDQHALHPGFRILSDYLGAVDFSAFEHHRCDVPNPSAEAFVGAVPWKGWEPSTQQEFAMTPDGRFPGMENLSCYLQGEWNATLGRRAGFHVRFDADGGFARIEVKAVSSSGSNSVEISVDGIASASRSFAEAGSLEVAVPPGWHTVKFENRGEDWVEVASFAFGAEANRVLGHGLKSESAAFGYLYDREYGEWAGTWPPLAGARLVVSGLQPGNYGVVFTDPVLGAHTVEGNIDVFSGTAAIPVPSFSKDIAYRIVSAPLFVEHPQDQARKTKESARFRAMAVGSQPLFYRWRKDGAEIPGTAAEILEIASLRPADQGLYTCLAYNSFASAESSPARLEVDGAESSSAEPADFRSCFKISATILRRDFGQWQGTTKEHGHRPCD